MPSTVGMGQRRSVSGLFLISSYMACTLPVTDPQNARRCDEIPSTDGNLRLRLRRRTDFAGRHHRETAIVAQAETGRTRAIDPLPSFIPADKSADHSTDVSAARKGGG